MGDEVTEPPAFVGCGDADGDGRDQDKFYKGEDIASDAVDEGEPGPILSDDPEAQEYFSEGLLEAILHEYIVDGKQAIQRP
jgi:hypothetical protein